jgi:hypothetical protein
MNTTPDDLEQQQLMAMLQQVEPSWKVTPLPPDPATDIFRKPAPPRRAQFSFSDPFGPITTGGNTGGGSGSGGDAGLIPVTVTGAYNGTPTTGIFAAYQAPE